MISPVKGTEFENILCRDEFAIAEEVGFQLQQKGSRGAKDPARDQESRTRLV